MYRFTPQFRIPTYSRHAHLQLDVSSANAFFILSLGLSLRFLGVGDGNDMPNSICTVCVATGSECTYREPAKVCLRS
jgi:hypothetical protein